VLFAGSANGELARIINTHDCGMVVESGDGAGLARCVRELATNPERARAMGQRGRSLYETMYAPSIAFAAWEKVLT